MNLSLPQPIEAVIDAFFAPHHVAANDIQQHEWEARTLLRLMLDELKPERTAELGTYKGLMTALLSLATAGKTVTMDIEPYGSEWGVSHGKNIESVIADASLEGTPQLAVSKLEGQIDLLFIDDGHYYETIVKEFSIWKPAVRKGGWICFHDINPLANIGPHGTQPDCIQVPRFWQELKGEKEEIIATKESGYRGHIPHGGIGILRV